MFERYTEHARRAIFFARYEASTFGSNWIETEHLLLGLLREDKVLPTRLAGGATEAIRKQIEAQITSPIPKIPTSVDLPLSQDSKLALLYGSEESEKLLHRFIDCGHMVLGLLRVRTCAAALMLRQRGIEYESYFHVVSEMLSAKIERPAGQH